jgi:hypothetical protein
MRFVWNFRNVEHISRHGIKSTQAEYVVENARPPYPQMLGDEKRLVVGRLGGGEYVQVIDVPSRKEPGAVYVMHSRYLTPDEKRRFRRRMR